MLTMPDMLGTPSLIGPFTQQAKHPKLYLDVKKEAGNLHNSSGTRRRRSRDTLSWRWADLIVQALEQ